MKPIVIDLAEGAQSGLAANSRLQVIDNAVTHHIRHDLRLPLGIYNISTARVLQKARDLCERLEIYTLSSDLDGESRTKKAQALIDYIELAIYAAADHVDDLELITKHFYRSDEERKRSKINKQFLTELKTHKHFIAAAANYIKHSQHRIRLFQLEFFHGGHQGIMHGYVIEGVVEGVVRPSPIFHSDDRNIFSITSLVWEIITFVLKSSRALADFLADKARVEGPTKTESKALSDAIIAAMRLPIYGLDETDPFKSMPLQFAWNDEVEQRMASGFYGSMYSPWHPRSSFTQGGSRIAFAGDGVTQTFSMLLQPKRVSLRNLERAL